MGERIIHRSLALLPASQRGQGGRDDELVEPRRGHLADERPGQDTCDSRTGLGGGAFCLLPCPAPPLYRFTDDPRSWDSVRRTGNPL